MLAREALEECGMMRSQGLTHGACIYSNIVPDPPGPWGLGGIARGDVVQFSCAVFLDGAVAGSPHHTAIITRVLDPATGDVEVLEQNVAGSKRVVKGRYILGRGAVLAGVVRVFRPVDKKWGWYRGRWRDGHGGERCVRRWAQLVGVGVADGAQAEAEREGEMAEEFGL